MLPYGRTEISLDIEPFCSPETITYDSTPGFSDPQERIRQSLQQPIGSPPLHEIASGRKNAVILISDISRLCPSYLFLPALIGELNRGGLPDGRIRIVVALGMHRKQTESELAALVGEEVYRRVSVANHSALSEDCVDLGRTRQGTPIEINRTVAEADLLIATGNIEPHRLAGVSGGAKALMPGVASERSIQANHALSQRYRPQIGNPDNPIRRDLEDVLEKVPIHFLFNVIVNHRRELLDAVAGDPIAAHRRGVELARRRFLIPNDKRYDLTIVSPGGFPKDLQLYQAVKTLQNAAGFTKPGGAIILAAQCAEAFGNGVFQHWVETIRDRRVIEQKLKERFVLGAHKISHISELLDTYTVYLYSSMPASQVELVGFRPVSDLTETVKALTQNGSAAISVAVMPYGALTFPLEP